MSESSVLDIIDNNAKHGTSSKTGKDWSMSKVKLQNQEVVYIFNPIDIGDVVESVQNGEYLNWQKVKPEKSPSEIPPSTAQLDRIESQIQDMHSDLRKFMYPEGDQ